MENGGSCLICQYRGGFRSVHRLFVWQAGTCLRHKSSSRMRGWRCARTKERAGVDAVTGSACAAPGALKGRAKSAVTCGLFLSEKTPSRESLGELSTTLRPL